MADLSPAAIVAAARANHLSWSATRARLTGGSSVERAGGRLSHLRGNLGGGDEVELLFAEPADDDLAGLLDELEQLAESPEDPDGRPTPVRSVGWWSATGDVEGTLGPRLLARGFQWGWAPHWMGMGVSAEHAEPERWAERFPPPAGVVTREVSGADGWDVTDVPYLDGGDAAEVGPLARLDPPTVTLAAFEPAPLDLAGGAGARAGRQPTTADRLVGRVVVHLASGDPGNAGLYACGVAPDRRGRGTGAALTAAAVDRAAELGARLLTLNATEMGEPVYRRVGFASAGHGRTWWLTPRQLGTSRPSPALVDLVEAIGYGDLATLDASLASLSAHGGIDLDAPLRCGLTPIGVAVQFGRTAAAERLVERGAPLDVVSAWDLGWRDRVPELLRRSPELADRRTGDLGATPLHVAVERDDEELARVVLAAGPDLTIRDRTYQSDALGWAEHLGRPRMAELIRPRLDPNR